MQARLEPTGIVEYHNSKPSLQIFDKDGSDWLCPQTLAYYISELFTVVQIFTLQPQVFYNDFTVPIRLENM